MNIGVIDVGSNAIRLLIAAATEGGGFTAVANYREPVRLGHDVFLRGRISEDTIARAVRAFTLFADLLRQHGVDRYRAIATSAAREASNKSTLVERIRRESGLDLEIISGVEEGRLIYSAVRQRVDLRKSNAIIAELGGGSMELILVRDGKLAKIETFKIGAVRLLEMLTNEAPDGQSFPQLVKDYVGGIRGHLQKATEGFTPGRFIATGGNVEKMAALAASTAAAGEAGMPVVARDQLRELILKLSSLSYRERIEQLGLDEDRADVILPASIVVYGVMEATGVDRFTAPLVGLKEGIAVELATTIGQEAARTQLREAAIFLGRRYQFDESHAQRVAENSIFLFERLQPIHRMGARYAELLDCAAILHDIGFYVNGRQHHKHSFYLIVSSNIPGLSGKDKLISANVARYHRRASPKPSHRTLQKLPREERENVRRLAAILRIADALDRDHMGTVTPVSVSTNASTVTIRVKVRGDLALEQWAINRKSDLFRDVFGYRVKVEES